MDGGQKKARSTKRPRLADSWRVDVWALPLPGAIKELAVIVAIAVLAGISSQNNHINQLIKSTKY